MSEEEICALGVKEYEEIENEMMKKNAWHVSKLLVECIDGAPVLGESMKSYLSEPNKDMFYFNERYLTKYNAYIEKILQFFHTHSHVGELFMEFM